MDEPDTGSSPISEQFDVGNRECKACPLRTCMPDLKKITVAVRIPKCLRTEVYIPNHST